MQHCSTFHTRTRTGGREHCACVCDTEPLLWPSSLGSRLPSGARIPAGYVVTLSAPPHASGHSRRAAERLLVGLCEPLRLSSVCGSFNGIYWAQKVPVKDQVTEHDAYPLLATFVFLAIVEEENSLEARRAVPPISKVSTSVPGVAQESFPPLAAPIF